MKRLSGGLRMKSAGIFTFSMAAAAVVLGGAGLFAVKASTARADVTGAVIKVDNFRLITAEAVKTTLRQIPGFGMRGQE